MGKRQTDSVIPVRAVMRKTSKDFTIPDSHHRLQSQFSTEKTSDFDNERPYADPHQNQA